MSPPRWGICCAVGRRTSFGACDKTKRVFDSAWDESKPRVDAHAITRAMDPSNERIIRAVAQDLTKGSVNSNCNKHDYIAAAVAVSHSVLSQEPFSLNDVLIRDLQ